MADQKDSNSTFDKKIEQAKATTKRAARKTMWLLLIGLVLAGIGYYIWRDFNISEGTRTGVLYKISKKGYVFKTYEGELQLAGAQMMTPESIWSFSGNNETVYHQLMELEGETVRLFYREKQDAFPWQGDTNYMIYKVEVLKEKPHEHLDNH